jgi:hypothetical protein
MIVVANLVHIVQYLDILKKNVSVSYYTTLQYNRKYSFLPPYGFDSFDDTPVPFSR